MSSFDRRILLLGALALGGCGFRPLYGGGDSGASALFGQVAIIREPGELGFRLREALVERLRPSGNSAPLQLVTRSSVERDGLAIEEDDQVTRYNLRLRTRYELRRIGEDAEAEPLASGQKRSIAAYNATPSQYATLVAEREVLRRAAEDIATKISRDLALAYQPGWLTGLS